MLERYNNLKRCKAKSQIMQLWLQNGENIAGAMQVWCTRSKETSEAHERRQEELYGKQVRDLVGEDAERRLCAALKEKKMYAANSVLPHDEDLFLCRIPRGMLSKWVSWIPDFSSITYVCCCVTGSRLQS